MMGTGTVIEWPLWPSPSYKGEGFVKEPGNGVIKKGDGLSWPYV